MKSKLLPGKIMIRHLWYGALLIHLTLGNAWSAGSRIEPTVEPVKYPDGRPAARWRLEAQDHGVVLRHGSGPEKCDTLGARDVWVWENGGTYFMHYDGAGPKGWLACLATSRDLVNWTPKGPVLDFGKAGEDDSASASYGVTFFDGREWHLFYLGTPNVTPPPDLIPGFPYLTLKARSDSPEGPWQKQKAIIPFRTKPGTYYSATASPGHVIRQGVEYLMFFSASTDQPIKRTLSVARTKDLNGPWTIAPEPIVPLEEQVENSSLYYDEESKTWFLFTNHVGLEDGLEYTDAIWVYWTKDLNHWNRDHKAVVLDRTNCKWSKHIIGLPSVVKSGNRLAIFYDGNDSPKMPGGVKSHMNRDVGLAWLDLPLIPPVESTAVPTAAGKITVASYYFGNYHPGDPRNTKMKGKDWSEWDLVKAAKPRFLGHQQPKVPLWGYGDESDPKVMAQKIAAAADHGIDAFIFDWYYYDDGPFLDRPIDIGFLQATNNHRLKFSFMWANHDWLEIQPYHRGTPQKLVFPGKVTPAGFERICDHLIKDYFQHPSYWRIDGRPYFSFYELTKLLESFGTVEATRAALDQFRAKARAAGLPGLHLNAVVWGQPILPAEKKPADTPKLVRDLGFDSVTSYVWIHHVPLPQQVTDYNFVRDAYFQYWDGAKTLFDVPYYPNVSMGWDSSPRAAQEDEFGNFGYPFTNTMGQNTPQNFRAALELTKQRLLAQPDGPRIFNINCWNEWTEGSYLEPDTVNGLQYLEAVRDVFGKGK
jgi:predicted GH43/DUF377 family glycosyl hydrolase